MYPRPYSDEATKEAPALLAAATASVSELQVHLRTVSKAPWELERSSEKKVLKAPNHPAAGHLI